MTLLPGRWAYEIMRLERYTFIILIALFVIGPFGKLLALASLKIRWLMVHFMALFF